MKKTVGVLANSIVFFLSLTIAAFTAQYSLPLALFFLLASLDPLCDVHSYVTSGRPASGRLQMLLEGLSAVVSIISMITALLYLSYGFLLFPLLLLAFSTLSLAISLSETKSSFNLGLQRSPYLE